LELEDFVKWECQHPEIEDDTDDGVAPNQGVDIKALARGFMGPIGPIVRDGGALKYRDEDEEGPYEAVEHNRSPQESPRGPFWEYAEEEKKQGEFQ